ncbi:hypothetical protein STEG23_030945, partial [Scotinomys teguina]
IGCPKALAKGITREGMKKRILPSSGGLPTALIIAYNVWGSIGPHWPTAAKE